MTTEAVPLVLAAVFTAGCMVIKRAERHAETVCHALGALFSGVVALLILEVLVHVMPPARVIPPEAARVTVVSAKLMGRVQAPE